MIFKQMRFQLPFAMFVTQIGLSMVLEKKGKLQSPKWLCVRGTQRILESDDLREPVTRQQSLIKYSGACMDSD